MNEKVRIFLKRSYLFLFKYLFSVSLPIISLLTTKDVGYTLIALIELSFIFVLSNQILKKHKWIGQIVNSILILLFNVQMLILFFSNSFVTLIMIDNISSWEALQGRALGYGIAIVLLLLFSFLPINYIELQPEKDYQLYKIDVVSIIVLGILTCFDLLLISSYSDNHSSFLESYHVVEAKIEYEQLKAESKRESDKLAEKFEKSEIENFIQKPSNLKDKPNVILIFTEGFSQHIIDDERNITPTIREYQEKSLSFTNYFNHTFATYRGLSGQLFSGYQLENTSRNYLVSLPMVFENQGYKTSFINTEPENKEFSDYLSKLGFNQVISAPLTKGQKISFDKEAYEELFQQLEKQSSTSNPFFVSMYTFGTHVGMDGMDKKYGDGSDRVLNRFYDMDQQFKTFIRKFNESKLSENTILVFTTDHATYVDDEYLKAFPDSSRQQGNLDKVPFFIYYKGIAPQLIDVNGRNSINLTPTILDYLDYSQANYFLGTSLFSDSNTVSEFSSTFSAELVVKNTNGSVISDIPEEELKTIKSKMNDYYKLAQNDPS